MRISAAEFVTSASGAGDLPRDRLPEIALVGRSNVGKSSLINALVRRKVARTSQAPGKTRLANIYRVRVNGTPQSVRQDPDREQRRGAFAGTLYLVDLPGYGYARGGSASARGFEALTREYFGQGRPIAGAILAVDSRHPGLAADLGAEAWLAQQSLPVVTVATKVDRLSRAERERALRAFDSFMKDPVLPVSAVTGEGLDDLWKLIVTLCRSRGTAPRQR